MGRPPIYSIEYLYALMRRNKPPMRPEPTCCDCGKTASELFAVAENKDDYNDAVSWAVDDGTYNRVSNRFCCNECYIARGCPSSPKGWKAP